ncbi:MAG: FHIPEP family type III secretion protein [Promethearchaeota archaeon]
MILGQIQVDIKLDPSLGNFIDPEMSERKELEAHLMECLNDLVSDLKLPLSLSIEVSGGKDSDQINFGLYQVNINNRKCKLQLSSLESQAQDVEAIGLSRSIARTIYENRELIITASISEKIRKNWLTRSQNDYLTAIQPKEFHESLLVLIRRGIAFNRAEELINAVKGEQKEWSLVRVIEESIFTLDALALNIFLNQAQFDRIVLKSKEKSQPITSGEPIETLLSLLYPGLFYEYGIMIPEVKIDIDRRLKDNDFRIQINDLRFPPIRGLNQDQFMVNDIPERLTLLGLTGKKIINPANESESSVVPNRDGSVKICEEAGLTTWDPAAFIIIYLAAKIRKNLPILLTTETVRLLMEKMQLYLPKLIEAANFFDIMELTWILRELLDEGISIRNLRSILEALLSIMVVNNSERSTYSLSIPDTLNSLRQSLKWHITSNLSNNNNLIVFLLDDQIEAIISGNNHLSEEEHDKLIRVIYEAVRPSYMVTGNNPVILTTLEARKKLKRLIEKEFPRLMVVCYEELPPDLYIQPIGRISWSEEKKNISN